MNTGSSFSSRASPVLSSSACGLRAACTGVEEGFIDDANPDESPLPPPQDATDNATSNGHAKRRRLDSTRVLFMSFPTPDAILHLQCVPGIRKFKAKFASAGAQGGEG
ncbi:hypothetical protein [Variovorax davisae]|uniref:hypothetical protein n=1 Tax=Variovorax davisae TaxID=3053515 RepID=UPI002574D8BA|nr:hypothetical protein [Variovorax sp. J22P271]